MVPKRSAAWPVPYASCLMKSERKERNGKGREGKDRPTSGAAAREACPSHCCEAQTSCSEAVVASRTARRTRQPRCPPARETRAPLSADLAVAVRLACAVSRAPALAAAAVEPGESIGHPTAASPLRFASAARRQRCDVRINRETRLWGKGREEGRNGGPE